MSKEIEILNKLGMIHSDDPNYKPKTNSWNAAVEALKRYKNPAAQALLARIQRSVENTIDKK